MCTAEEGWIYSTQTQTILINKITNRPAWAIGSGNMCIADTTLHVGGWCGLSSCWTIGVWTHRIGGKSKQQAQKAALCKHHPSTVFCSLSSRLSWLDCTIWAPMILCMRPAFDRNWRELNSVVLCSLDTCINKRSSMSFKVVWAQMRTLVNTVRQCWSLAHCWADDYPKQRCSTTAVMIVYWAMINTFLVLVSLSILKTYSCRPQGNTLMTIWKRSEAAMHIEMDFGCSPLFPLEKFVQ